VRLGARVVACDAANDEVTQVRNTIGAMVDAGEVTKRDEAGAVQGNALRLPFGEVLLRRRSARFELAALARATPAKDEAERAALLAALEL